MSCNYALTFKVFFGKPIEILEVHIVSAGTRPVFTVRSFVNVDYDVARAARGCKVVYDFAVRYRNRLVNDYIRAVLQPLVVVRTINRMHAVRNAYCYFFP